MSLPVAAKGVSSSIENPRHVFSQIRDEAQFTCMKKFENDGFAANEVDLLSGSIDHSET